MKKIVILSVFIVFASVTSAFAQDSTLQKKNDSLMVVVKKQTAQIVVLQKEVSRLKNVLVYKYEAYQELEANSVPINRSGYQGQHYSYPANAPHQRNSF